MKINSLTPSLSVADQIHSADLAEIAQAGFKSIICNRPDGESFDQTSFQDIEKAAQSLGLQLAFLPIVAGQITDEQIQAFDTLLGQLPSPVLAYCRSGTRSTVLWSLSQAKRLALDDIIDKAAHAGYDVTALAGRIAQLQAS